MEGRSKNPLGGCGLQAVQGEGGDLGSGSEKRWPLAARRDKRRGSEKRWPLAARRDKSDKRRGSEKRWPLAARREERRDRCEAPCEAPVSDGGREDSELGNGSQKRWPLAARRERKQVARVWFGQIRIAESDVFLRIVLKVLGSPGCFARKLNFEK